MKCLKPISRTFSSKTLLERAFGLFELEVFAGNRLKIYDLSDFVHRALLWQLI